MDKAVGAAALKPGDPAPEQLSISLQLNGRSAVDPDLGSLQKGEAQGG
jgi:hypothetical protein